MTAVERTKQRAAQLRDRAHGVRSRTLDIQERTRVLAEVIAATEDQIAATFDQLARQQPQRAAYLRSVGESARRYAARERKRLANQPGGTTAPARAAGLITNPEVRWRIEAAVSRRMTRLPPAGA